MENFIEIESGTFFNDLSDLIDTLSFKTDVLTVNDLSNTLTINCQQCVLEPVAVIDADWILERIDEERWPEDNDYVYERALKDLGKLNFDTINEKMPKLYYPIGEKFTITKQDLID